ncbi:hypothetical protein GUJ93_ZPchr0003g17027 [Zizania palustris]|uniref:Uncharacterized protein n=1 Tax=Zizania palustris TaxID=103762 RepID=A0A8J5VXB3_ZIZPA|nr:hypothetical protein GUJ93_ZPchr0003g17027 [Zizania palustris]
MVIQALGESTFMKPFAATLVQYMEKNLKATSPLACFKLLRWSCYILRWSQFATLSKGGFSRLANAQAILCQVLMDGSFRRCRTCKQLFTCLFSESIGAYNMYIKEVRDLNISIRDSPAFLNIKLDFTTTSSSLFAEYKSMFNVPDLLLKGKLYLPYYRIGIINALEQLSRLPPKQISRLAPSLSSFLLTCYKDDGYIFVGSFNSVVKTGFTKATQRLDAIYALFSVSRLAAIDTKADAAVLKEKLWILIAQNEPSLISVQLVIPYFLCPLNF